MEPTDLPEAEIVAHEGESDAGDSGDESEYESRDSVREKLDQLYSDDADWRREAFSQIFGGEY